MNTSKKASVHISPEVLYIVQIEMFKRNYNYKKIHQKKTTVGMIIEEAIIAYLTKKEDTQ